MSQHHKYPIGGLTKAVSRGLFKGLLLEEWISLRFDLLARLATSLIKDIDKETTASSRRGVSRKVAPPYTLVYSVAIPPFFLFLRCRDPLHSFVTARLRLILEQ